MLNRFRTPLAAAVVGCLTVGMSTGMIARTSAAHAAVAPARTAGSSLDGPVHVFKPSGSGTHTATTPPPTNMTYHGGVLMPSSQTYAIFWLPAGMHYESAAAGAAGDTRYENLITRYLQDVGNTPFYNLLTQYSQPGHPIGNVSTFGGSFVDTRPYAHNGTVPSTFTGTIGSQTNPLVDRYAGSAGDIDGEVDHAMTVKGWTQGLNKEYFVFTAAGIHSCFNATMSSCSFNSYCAYHSAHNMSSSDGTLNHVTNGTLYGNMPDGYSLHINDPTHHTCGVQMPNSDAYADVTLSGLSHEHFETVTDPIPGTGWMDDVSASTDGGEIGDKCAYNFGPAVNPFASVAAAKVPDLWLHAHPYTLQTEWSNEVKGCVFSHAPVTKVLSAKIPPLTMAALPATITGKPTDNVKYTISMTNPSDVDPATKLVLTTALPLGFSYVPASATLAPKSVSVNAITHRVVIEWDMASLNVHTLRAITFHATHAATLPSRTSWADAATLRYANSIGAAQPVSPGSVMVTVQ